MNIRKMFCLAVILLMGFALMGCDTEPDPAADYENKLDDLNIIERFDEFNDDINSLGEILARDLELITVENMEESKEKTLTLLEDISFLTGEVKGMDLADEELVEVNNYLVQYLEYLQDGIGEYYVMINSMADFKELERDIEEGTVPDGFEATIDGIFMVIDEAEAAGLNYFSLANEAISNWDVAFDEYIQK